EQALQGGELRNRARAFVRVHASRVEECDGAGLSQQELAKRHDFPVLILQLDVPESSQRILRSARLERGLCVLRPDALNDGQRFLYLRDGRTPVGCRRGGIAVEVDELVDDTDSMGCSV